MSHRASIAAQAQEPEAAFQTVVGEMRCVTRQPVMDKNHRVHGYQLNFRVGSNSLETGGGVHPVCTVLDDAVIFGIDRFTSGLPAFVTCCAESLTEEWVSVLPAGSTVLEVPAALEPSARLVDSCLNLKGAGFKLALTGFTWDLSPHPLLDRIDYVKADLSCLDSAGCQRLRKNLQGTPIAMAAEKVETQEDFRRACAEGFTLFQGYYFCRPEAIENAKIPANRRYHLDILRQLYKDPLDLKKICPMVLRDASLTYRLLRLVNSPIYAMRQEVRSIESAIMVVGETAFRRIATLAILSEFNAEQPPEILHMALVRARFCELGAKLCGQDPGEQYLLGMMSLLPAMMLQPMEALAPELPLRDEVRRALLGENNRERCLLGWIERHERNDQTAWNAIAEAHGLNQQRLVQFYIDALVWDATPRRSAA
jgi:EAL and modified HD-GYP domain-containing signal transduction protein